eukprot:CAMPEP_0174747360 /NCGR_PEP_ID=MMETSP1094-20130205/91023_1 /TAXON_ID=156173 /ORGANISM="Chrysochromulina brevifilum, Strain UTEX LB 985" /LENGTH=36 /DNA_ID= /DNA_START= /DNA_END= /DNA_ORIENTATION=
MKASEKTETSEPSRHGADGGLVKLKTGDLDARVARK